MLTSHEVEEKKVIRNLHGLPITVTGRRIQAEINRPAILTHCPRVGQPRIIAIRIRVSLHQTQDIVIKQVTSKGSVGVGANCSECSREISHVCVPNPTPLSLG